MKNICQYGFNVTISYAGLMVSLYLGVVEIITTLIEYSHYNTVHVSHHTCFISRIRGYHYWSYNTNMSSDCISTVIISYHAFYSL